ncbi:hypothetical protein WEI85_35690 [Actinomycetes bacterium KLBMP 9797]
MSAFADRVMVSLTDPAHLRELVAPAADAGHQRIRRLFARVYSLPSAVLRDVLTIEVASTEFQRPLFPRRHTSGTWTRTQPDHRRTDIASDEVDLRAPHWLDVSARLTLTVVLEVDPAEIESIRSVEIENFTTLAEFRAHFRYFDLDAFLARHGISTVAELRRAYHHLLTEVTLRPAPEFEPADPANQRRFDLPLAFLVRDAIDLTEALRAARHAGEIADRVLPYRRSAGHAGEADATAPYATVLVFPAAAVPATGMSQASLEQFFDAAGVLAVFVTP